MDFTGLVTFRTDVVLPEDESDGSPVIGFPDGSLPEAIITADENCEDAVDELGTIAPEKEGIYTISEANEGPSEQEAGKEEQHNEVSAANALPEKKAHKKPVPEKARDVSPADKDTKTASKPRQYNLGDYL
jgi:hypothetical protein